MAQQSQEPISALKGHNSNAPIDVAADRLEVQDRADRAVFVGNVHVKQAELTLDTSRLTVAYSSGQGVQIQRLDASGGVTVRSPSETATRHVRDLRPRPQADHPGRRRPAPAERIRRSTASGWSIDLNSGRAVIEGGPAGVGQSGGRVTGHFTVPQKNGA